MGIKNNKVWKNYGDSRYKGTVLENVIDSPLYQEDGKEIAMKRHIKEVWVKFINQSEYSENEERLIVLLDKAPGDCAVKVYDASTRGCRTLSGHSFDEKQISLLTDFLGEDNAKFWERELKVDQKKARRNVPNIVQIIPCNHEMYAVSNGDDGGKLKSKVLMFALCDDQQIYPLAFDSWLGVSLLYEAAFDVSGYEMEGDEIYSLEGEKAEMRGIVDLADVEPCPIAAGFYDKFRARIAGIGTLGERNGILEEMEEYFRKCVGAEPQNRDKLSEAY